MLRPLAKLLLCLFLLTLPLFIPNYSLAGEVDWSFLPGDDPSDDQMIEFCKRRQGDQMNLETWYSGKCKAGNKSEEIGFSDIIIMDIYEKVNGPNDGSAIPNPFSENFIKKDSLLAQTGNAISYLYEHSPASTVNYLAYVRSNLAKNKIVKEAYAQTGFGFRALEPVLPLWRAIRNVAYFIFILAFVVYGFMIMFRMKINPQAVTSFQLAIPKVITVLLLVTFSYAIVGLLIDLMYLVLYLTLNIFQASGLISGNNIFTKMATGEFGGFFGTYTIFNFHLMLGGLSDKLYNAIFGLPRILAGIASVVLDYLTFGLIFKIILSIAVLYSLFKLWWSLVKAYVEIIISLIFSPVTLIGAIFPGNDTFGNWIRGLIANIAAFPTAMVLMLLAFIFIGNIQWFGIDTGLGIGNLPNPSGYFWSPPLAFGGTDAAGIMAVIGVGLLLMSSKFVEMVKDALKVPPFKYGSAIGEALITGMNVNHQWADSGYHMGPLQPLIGRFKKLEDFQHKTALNAVEVKPTVERISGFGQIGKKP